jgi:HPt (histidine-containing phosphotransfer) domain-containing protein
MLRLLRMLPDEPRSRMVAMYCDTLVTQLAELGQALEGSDQDAATALAHKLAGSAAMMQDAALAQPARAVEQALREDALIEALRLWPLLRTRAARTLDVLRASYPAA